MYRSSVKSLGIVVLTLGLAVGCAAGPKSASMSDGSGQAIADAKAAMKKAEAVGYLWTTTGAILKHAEEAAGKGDEKAAVGLANKAKEEAELAVQQHDSEQKMNRDLRTS